MTKYSSKYEDKINLIFCLKPFYQTHCRLMGQFGRCSFNRQYCFRHYNFNCVNQVRFIQKSFIWKSEQSLKVYARF